MVNLTAIRESNAALSSLGSGKVALFAGGSSGLGLATLKEFARHADRPKIYIVGRARSKLDSIVADLRKINPQGTYESIVSEVSLFRNVDTVCDQLRAKEKTLDLLFMSLGYIKVGRQDDNEDCVEESLSLRYYIRMRFVHNLLPLLKRAPSARIVSVLAGGQEGKLNWDDLLLQKTFSLVTNATHTATMTSLALQEISAANPTISCVHEFPGVVMTPAYGRISEGWPWPLRVIFDNLIFPLMSFFTTSITEGGERLLFYSTSARYPPSGVKDSPGAGVALPSGVQVARGSDWHDGSGCYLIDPNGEASGNKAIMEEYRKQDAGKKIWDHTHEVWDRALQSK